MITTIFSLIQSFFCLFHFHNIIILSIPLFQKLDLNNDGIVTVDEFLDSCLKVRIITSLLTNCLITKQDTSQNNIEYSSTLYIKVLFGLISVLFELIEFQSY